MKNKGFLKAAVLCLAAVMFCGCGIINVVDTTAIATVNGEDVTVNEYMYYLAITQEQLLQSIGMTTAPEGFWTAEENKIEGKTAEDFIKDAAFDNAVISVIVAQEAKKAGYNAESPEAKSMINNAKSQMTAVMDKYKVVSEGVDAAYVKAYLRNELFSAYKEDGKIDVSENAVGEYFKSNYRTVKHILFLTVDPATGESKRTDEEAKQLADDTFAKLTSANFDSYMNELSEDTGLATNPGGYTFAQDGSMVAEFEDVAFKLNEGEISEPVKTSYGYHILKREPLVSYEEYLSQASNDEEKASLAGNIAYMLEYKEETKYTDEWKAQADVKKNDKAFDKITIK